MYLYFFVFLFHLVNTEGDVDVCERTVCVDEVDSPLHSDLHCFIAFITMKLAVRAPYAINVNFILIFFSVCLAILLYLMALI